MPMFDAVKVGRADPQPLSSWMKLNDSWYHVRGKDDGAKVGFRKANPEYFKTGEIQADWSGPRGTKLTLLIVRGRGDFAGTAFDIADGKPHEVPVGTYELAFGRIESGRGARQMTAHVFGGPDVTVTVEEGETAKFDLGEPFLAVEHFLAHEDGGHAENAPPDRVLGVGDEMRLHLGV